MAAHLSENRSRWWRVVILLVIWVEKKNKPRNLHFAKTVPQNGERAITKRQRFMWWSDLPWSVRSALSACTGSMVELSCTLLDYLEASTGVRPPGPNFPFSLVPWIRVASVSEPTLTEGLLQLHKTHQRTFKAWKKYLDIVREKNKNTLWTEILRKKLLDFQCLLCCCPQFPCLAILASQAQFQKTQTVWSCCFLSSAAFATMHRIFASYSYMSWVQSGIFCCARGIADVLPCFTACVCVLWSQCSGLHDLCIPSGIMKDWEQTGSVRGPRRDVRD